MIRFLVSTAVLTALCFTAIEPAKAQKNRANAQVENDSAPVAVTYGGREDVMLFADAVAQRQQLGAQTVRDILRRARFIPAVGKAIMPPPAGTAKNWAAYRARFVEPSRIHAGLAFWQTHAKWLELAEERYGVPAEIVVGIVGVETLYGRHMGSFRVIDALATLAFDFPSGRKDRSPFFRDELEQFLVLTQREGVDPLSVRGSFAGAMGLPQFMPSSIMKYAVDFDGNGHIDLHKSHADVIGSVARYLSDFGWQRDLPTHFDVSVPVEVSDRAVLLAPDILPTFAPQEFVDRGALLPAQAMQTTSKLALVELQNGEAAPSYVAGTTNFYAVTRYNWSSYYAMAVIDLGAAVKQARQTRSAQTQAAR
ncbi:MAG: lytic murein transglycosylase B [Rhizobacter sp.]